MRSQCTATRETPCRAKENQCSQKIIKQINIILKKVEIIKITKISKFKSMQTLLQNTERKYMNM